MVSLTISYLVGSSPRWVKSSSQLSGVSVMVLVVMVPCSPSHVTPGSHPVGTLTCRVASLCGSWFSIAASFLASSLIFLFLSYCFCSFGGFVCLCEHRVLLMSDRFLWYLCCFLTFFVAGSCLRCRVGFSNFFLLGGLFRMFSSVLLLVVF